MAKSKRDQINEMTPEQLEDFIVNEKAGIQKLVDNCAANGYTQVMGVKPKIDLIRLAMARLGKTPEEMDQEEETIRNTFSNARSKKEYVGIVHNRGRAFKAVREERQKKRGD